MLATDIEEHMGGMPYGADFRRRLSQAEKFILDPLACAMAAGVSLSRPSSMIQALGFARLPFEPTWIEFANADIRKAMSDLGSPNKPTGDQAVTIERAGFLLSTSGDSLSIEYAHRDRHASGVTVADLSPVRATFSLKGFSDAERELMTMFALTKEAPKIASGRVQKHLDVTSSDPAEAAADMEIRERLAVVRHPELAAFRQGLASRMGEAAVAAIEQGQQAELSRLFLLVALPALILLNCRNAVDTERVPAPAKLNAQRAKKGKPPLPEHLVVRMHLSPARRRVYESQGGRAAAARGGQVLGHFKVRRTGVYWWSPHWRGGRSTETAPKRTFLVTR